jgi:hypothetical protein
MVFNATFNNISAISWWSVLLVEETRVPGENHRPSLWLHSINIITTENIKIVIIWWLDVQPPVQSVPITTNVVSSNLVHGEVYI